MKLLSKELGVLVAVAAVALVVVYLLKSGVSCPHTIGQVVTVNSDNPENNNLGGGAQGSVSTTAAKSADSHHETPGPESQSRVDYYKSQIIHPVKLDTRCTLLVPTYKRVRMLILIIQNYCAMSDSLEKIVVVWNDIKSEIPSSVLDLREKCGPELKILHMTKNKLSNRFLPGNYSKEIVTECKCLAATF